MQQSVAFAGSGLPVERSSVYEHARTRSTSILQRICWRTPGSTEEAWCTTLAIEHTSWELSGVLADAERAAPKVAHARPQWYAHAHAFAAECAIIADAWREQLAGPAAVWAPEHAAHFALDVERFGQLRTAALNALERAEQDPVAAAGAAPFHGPLAAWREGTWDEIFPTPRVRPRPNIMWLVAACATALFGTALAATWPHEPPTRNGRLGNVLGGADRATPKAPATPLIDNATGPARPPQTTAVPPTKRATPAAGSRPLTHASPHPTRPEARSKPTSAAPATAGSATQVTGITIDLIGGDQTPQAEAYLTVTTTDTGSVTLSTDVYGVTANGTRTHGQSGSQTLSGHTSYSLGSVINTTPWCGQTLTYTATGPGAAGSATGSPGC